MSIRPGSAEDVEAVLRLERAIPEAPHWAMAEYEAIVGAPDGLVRRCLMICRDEEDLLGFAVAKVVAGEGELESVAVRAAARRGGVGRALCAAVLAWAWELDAAAIDLEVRASSNGARALYAKLGFVEVGRRRSYYAAPVEDALLMRLAP